MKAMIFAAGMGTRLKPLTDNKPKALVEVGGIPLLEIIIKRLISFGFYDLVINVHHFYEQIYEFLALNQNFGITIHVSDERDLLLDTGGGLKYAQELLSDGEPVLIHNVDILTDLDLKTFYSEHCRYHPLATLAVKERDTSRSLLINNFGELCGWRNNNSGELKHVRGDINQLIPIAFSGIHVVSPEIFEHITEMGVFSIIEVYLRLAKEHKIQTYLHSQNFWLDLGRKENFDEAAIYLNKLL
jgi:N-acetyl-alpha-D-muramate 1-phosphate uridylyltransferase